MLTFKEFILENDEKPKFRLAGDAGKIDVLGYTQATGFHVTHPSIPKGISGTIMHNEKTHEGEIHVSGEDDTVNVLGPKHVKHVLGRLRHEIPTLHHLETKKSHINIKHIKPIPPDKE